MVANSSSVKLFNDQLIFVGKYIKFNDHYLLGKSIVFGS